MRKLSALLALAVVVPALTACTSNPFDGCTAPYTSGDASSAVTVSGDFGSTPIVDMPTPLYTATNEVSTLIAGEGAPLRSGQPVIIELAMINGSTGEIMQQTAFSGEGSGTLSVVGGDKFPVVDDALECAQVGSRLVVAGTALDTHDGAEFPGDGLKAKDSIFFVVDILDAFKAKADGATRAGANGDPTVVLAPNGTPGITIPKSAPPTELVVSVLKQGDGAELAEGEHAMVHYTGAVWANNKIFESTWEKNTPTFLQIGSAELIDGINQGLVGQKVGSQVLLVIPPALAYGPEGSGSISPNSTLVFVVDILGVLG